MSHFNSPKELIAQSTYAININQKLISKVEEYCTLNNLNIATKVKMLVFTSMIYKRMIIYDSQLVNISKNVFVKVFSTIQYFEIKKHCLESTIDQVYNHVQSAGIPSAFRIKPELFDKRVIVYYPNQISSKLERNFKKKKCKTYDEAIEKGKLFEDNRVQIQNEFLLDIISYYSHNNVHNILSKMHQKGILTYDNLNKNKAFLTSFQHGQYFATKPDLQGRVYSFYTMIKRELRSIVGEKYIEMDISNSHPFILSTVLYNSLFKNNNAIIHLLQKQKMNFIQDSLKSYQVSLDCSIQLLNYLNNLLTVPLQHLDFVSLYKYHNSVQFSSNALIEEVKWFQEIAQKGMFYISIVDQNLFNNYFYKKELGYYNPILINGGIDISDPKIDIKKEITKKSYMFWQNGDIIKRRSISKKCILNLLPNTTILLNHLKDKFGYKAIHSLITTIESNLVFKSIFDAYQQEKIAIGSVHDGMFVPIEYEDKFKSIFSSTSKQFLNCEAPLKVKKLTLCA